MAKAGALICLLIVSVDVVAGTFGIKAEINSNKVQITDSLCRKHEVYESFWFDSMNR